MEANSAIYYGGVVGCFLDVQKPGFSEMGINTGEGMNITIHTMGSNDAVHRPFNVFLNSEDAIVYTGSEDGMLWALDAVSGNVIWKKKVGGLLIGDVWIDDGVAYVASEDGHLYCMEAK